MVDNKTKKLVKSSGQACMALRHVSQQIKDYFPDLSAVLDKAEKQLMESVLDLYEND